MHGISAMGSRPILVTGAGGMLGTSIVHMLGDKYHRPVIGLSHRSLDVTHAAAVEAAIRHYRPAAVVHCAAKTAVDACETAVDETFRVNTWASRLVAQATARHGAELVFISSCGIFPNAVRPFHEDDVPAPRTIYGHSKRQAELIIATENPRTYIIRPGWLFGGQSGHSKNFVYQRFLEAQRVSVIRSVIDRFGSPTFVDDVSRAIHQLLETRQYGLYHVANEGMASRFEYVRSIVNGLGLQTPVVPCSAEDFPRPASVPVSEALTSRNLDRAGLFPLRPWQDALGEYLNQSRAEWRI